MERFQKNARVCFVGDSITANNAYLAHIAGYYRDHLGEYEVEFYNCGISGGTLKTYLSAFDEDVVPYEPTHVVLTTGINDSHRHFLERPAPDRYDRMREAFELFKTRLDAFAERVKGIGAELILSTPMPYDEYLESDVKVLRGTACAMLGYADYIRGYAKEHGYALCDYHPYLTREITLANEPLYNPDRVHPTPLGHYFMAKCFLASQGFDLPFSIDVPSSVLPWHELTRDLRDTFTAENFILSGDFSTSDGERMKAILSYVDNPATGAYGEICLSYAKRYPDLKKNQAKTVDLIKRFMKGE